MLDECRGGGSKVRTLDARRTQVYGDEEIRRNTREDAWMVWVYHVHVEVAINYFEDVCS